jgi:hypothetical protein
MDFFSVPPVLKLPVMTIEIDLLKRIELIHSVFSGEEMSKEEKKTNIKGDFCC